MSDILRTDSYVRVNFASSPGWTALHAACEGDHHGIVSILLAHPDIEVNFHSEGITALVVACRSGSSDCAALLLQDAHVNVNLSSRSHTQFREAVENGHIAVVRWWIALEKPVTTSDLQDLEEPQRTDAETGETFRNRLERRAAVKSLLDQFKLDHEKTRRQIQGELNISGSIFLSFLFLPFLL